MKSCLTTSLLSFFFFEYAKNLGRSYDTKRREKRGWPKDRKLVEANKNKDHLNVP